MALWVTKPGDDPLRFLLIVPIYFCFFSPLPACPSSCARRDKDKEAGTRVSFPRWTFSGIRRKSLSSLINSYVPYFLLPHVQDKEKKKELSCNILSLRWWKRWWVFLSFFRLCSLCKTRSCVEQTSRLLVLLECWCCSLLLCGCMNMYVRNKNNLINCYRYFILKEKLYKPCFLFCFFFSPVVVLNALCFQSNIFLTCAPYLPVLSLTTARQQSH